MLILLIVGYEIGIIAVIAIKSVIRFKEFHEKDNDYYILGNLFSLLVVVVSHILWVWFVNLTISPDKLLIEIFNTYI